MIRKLENRFLANYILMFVISTMIGIFAFMLLGFANDVISKTLVKNNYTAESLMRDDYRTIDPTGVIDNGGGVQVISANYEVIFSAGLNTLSKDKLSTSEFTDFLIMSKSKGIPFSYSIEYNPKQKFWLIVTFPTSLRIDFEIVYNKEFASVDTQGVVGVIVAVVLFYLALLGLCTIIYSKLTSIGIVNPLKKLYHSASRLKEGDYSSRVELNLTNEFGELGSIFNEMAGQIEQEIALREQSEENRKKLILDISHDLKNPLASVIGYSELCYSNPNLSKEQMDTYFRVIYNNSLRANKLITDLFELSKMESSEFTLNKTRVDICEYVRTEIGSAIPILDKAEFNYNIDIPEEEIYTMLDTGQMGRVFQNLVANAVQYNPKGTTVTVILFEKDDKIFIVFKDNGIGIPSEIAQDIFRPFVRADRARNSQSGGTGLGLAIVEKIISAHEGTISLITEENFGSDFIIQLPKTP